jgi:hypothetical protein
MTAIDLMTWLRSCCASHAFEVAGVFLRQGDHPWPIIAADAQELERKLGEGGHLRPLPKEPAALANVLEVSLVDFLLDAAHEDAGLVCRRGSERGYPDIEFTGPALGGAFHAVDVKVARRNDTRARDRTQSRITLYTGNTYFRHPDLHWPGTIRPFRDYASHLDIIVIYTLNEELTGRVEDIELIVQEPWRIASMQRSSTTREYIGAVDFIRDLREGRGAFATAEEFYSFWRAYQFRVSPQVQRQYERLVRQQREELDRLRGHPPDSGG